MTEPVRIFIGSSSNREDATIEIAYEHSLRKHLSDKASLDITWMRQSHDGNSPWGCWSTQSWSTPFSGFRWAIPEVCGFEGRAIYTDCDMINMRDISELLKIDMQGKPVAARRGTRFGGHEFCVMVFDCAMFKQHSVPVSRMKPDPESHRRMITKFSGKNNLVADLDPRWNCLDGEDLAIGDMWQLHFTNMATQPWKPSWYSGSIHAHPRSDVVQAYYQWYAEAKEAGYDDIALLEAQSKYLHKYNIIGR